MTMQATEQREKAQDTYNFLGLWRNQHGSEMHIKVINNGMLKGTFKTGVGAHEPEEEHALTGFVSGPLVSFCVNFGKYHSLTSWAGQHTRPNGADKIETMWHLARTLPERTEKDCLWAGIWTGSDTFCRVEMDSNRDLDLFDRPPFIPSHPLKVSKK